MLIVTEEANNASHYNFLDQSLSSSAQLACFEDLRWHKLSLIDQDIIVLVPSNNDISYSLQYLKMTSDANVVVISDSPQAIPKKYRNDIICFESGISKDFFNGCLQTLKNKAVKTDDISVEYINTLTIGKFIIKKIQHVPMIAKAIAQSINKTAQLQRGIYELLMNAFEHGIYQLGFDLKRQLISEKTYFAELNRRIQHPDFKNKHIELTLHKKDDATYLSITDPGLGFDHSPYLNFNKNLSETMTGRGISFAANYCFDQLTYTSEGRSVSAMIKHRV